MVSNKQYNDSAWHTVLFRREQTKGKLIIGGDDEVSAESTGNARLTSLQPPYLFGGVPSTIREDIEFNTGLEKAHYFQGCIRNIQVSGRPLAQPEKIVGTSPCSDQVENGVFFNGGFIKVIINLTTFVH